MSSLSDPRRKVARSEGDESRRSRRLRGSFILLSAAFSLAMMLLVAFSILALYGLSGARAYVHGESQWTKAQKQAVIALSEYASTGDQSHLDDFQQALSVNHGDRRARLTLLQDDPDYEVAREGFLAGRNRPEDVDLMIRLFVLGQSLPSFSEAIEAWTEADRLIAQLEDEARALQRDVGQFGPDSREVLERWEAIQATDQALTRQEERFSQAMGRVSDQLTRYFIVALPVAALLMILGAWFLTWRLLKSREQSESALVESEQRYQALVDQPEVGMWQVTPDGRIVYLNPAMRTLLGLPSDERVTGQPMGQFIDPADREKVSENRSARIDGTGKALEVTLLPRKGSARITLVHGSPIRVAERVIGHVGTCVDITGRKQVERELRHQALHDALTGLPNRKLFMDRLEMALKRSRRSKKELAVLFIDLDRFKVINDGLGHSAGDELLCEATARLESQVRERDTIARFGGDEFGIVVEPLDDLEDALIPARRIIHAFQRPFRINDVDARIGASIGIAVSSSTDVHAEELIRHADIAMYAAKRAGGGAYHVFDPELDEFQQSRPGFESDLWQVVERGELQLFYQPIIDLETRRVESLEALVRWNHPEKGLITPDHFIPLAEETGAIVPIGRWVVRQACSDYVTIKSRLGDRAPAAIAVNVSDAEFRLGEPAEHFRESCTVTGAPASAIRVEVTESMLTLQPGALRSLVSLGHPIDIDDFGTGYASLDRLRHVPFSAIKIDRSFVAGFQQSAIDLSIIEAIAHVGRKMGVRVIAEGIEAGDQIAPLRELGCNYGQGYHFFRPMPLETFLRGADSSDLTTPG